MTENVEGEEVELSYQEKVRKERLERRLSCLEKM